MIGGGVAISLARRGRVPTVFDVRSDAATKLGSELVEAASVAEVSANTDVVLIAVVDEEQLRTVLTGPQGLLSASKPADIAVVLSTVARPVIHELAAICDSAGVTLLDCGVTPGDKAAENGMVAMIGGSEDAVQQARPVLEDFAKLVVHCGPLGAGMATKIARNVITYCAWAAVTEASGLVAASGVPLQTFLQVLQSADQDDNLLLRPLQVHAAGIDVPAELVEGVVKLAAKDLAAAQALGAACGVPLPLVNAATPLMPGVFKVKG